MTRLDQLIYNVCNRTGWSFRVSVKLKECAESIGYTFKVNDEPLLRKAVESGLIDVESLYYEYVDTIGEELDDEIFYAGSYFPDLVQKSVGEGAWIRVNTDIGFNIYYAKASPKKIDFERKIKEINMRMKFAKSLSSSELEKTGLMLNEVKILSLQSQIGIDPYYVSYRKSKSKKKYILPHEYELIKDIEFYMDSVSSRIKLKMYAQNDIMDKVFYMQSRGISKKKAISMCAAGQGYFIVDLKGMINDERAANGL